MPEKPKIEEKVSAATDILEQLESDDKLEITISKHGDEIILRNPKDGRIVKLVESADDSEIDDTDETDEFVDFTPLTPSEFEDGLRKLDEIGLTFTVDLIPALVAKDESAVDILSSELGILRERYPQLPREVGFIAHNTLTGAKYGIEQLGGAEAVARKSEIVKEILLTESYREEFFFKFALKVPSLELIDWEVNLKTHERGVQDVVASPYAMLRLSLKKPGLEHGEQTYYTVAVNRDLVDKHLAELTKLRKALDESFKLVDVLRDRKTLQEIK